MRIWVERDLETGELFECAARVPATSVEIADSIVMEWRQLRGRLQDIEEYIDRERVAQYRGDHAD